MVLTDEGHATTYFFVFHVSKGALMTLLHVEKDHWRAVELAPDSALPPVKVIGYIILVQNPRVLDATHYQGCIAR